MQYLGTQTASPPNPNPDSHRPTNVRNHKPDTGNQDKDNESP